MSIAITEDHRSLAETVRSFAEKRNLRGAARERLESPDDSLPEFWSEFAELGWLGLHLPEDVGGSGYGIEELVIVVEELARAIAPGPFVPTVIASALIAAAGDDDLRSRFLPGLADGSTVGAVALGGSVTVSDGTASGDAGVVLGGASASVLLVPVGDDVAVVAGVESGAGVAIESPPSLDPSRPSVRVTLDGAPVTIVPGARRALVDLARVILSADAVGVARECTEMGAAYSKERIQFGRPIAMYQAVKHHCANMSVATELATSAVWDAARAAATGGDQLSYAAAAAATLAAPAADLCANLNTQVHGGIAITWEHDAHLYMRRATTLLHYLDATGAAEELTDLTRQGVVREKAIELPPEAEAIRDEVRAFAQSITDLPANEQRTRLIETGFVMPHWPKPYGRAAGAVEQLVIEQEFSEAGITRPAYGITAWNILTIIQYATQDQIDRWVRPALEQDVIWCQLFSEPDAGSDAAGVKTKATRVDGGWLVNGQKVWTSGAHVAGMGFATVRTNPDVPKHDGITMMAIDMHADGVEVRPLKQTSGCLRLQRGVLQRRVRARRRRGRPGRRRLDGRPSDARQRERQHRRRKRRHVDARCRLDRPVRCPPRASRRRCGPRRPLHRGAPGDGPAQPAQREPCGRGWRAGAGRRDDQARVVGDRSRGSGDHDRVERPRFAVHGRPGRVEQPARADAPGHVDRRRNFGDQAQPDR